MKKNLSRAIALIGFLFLTSGAYSQTTLTIDNATNCTYEVFIRFYSTTTSCGATVSTENSSISTGTNTYTIPAGEDVKSVRIIGCCGGSSGSKTISYNCTTANIPSSDYGTVTCNSSGVDLNFVSSTLIEMQ